MKDLRAHIAIAVGVVISLGVLAVPASGAETLTGILAAAVVVTLWRGARLLPERSRSGWRTIAASTLLFGLGAFVRDVHGELSGSVYPLPSPADVLIVPAYGLLVWAVLSFVRNRAGEGSVDSWIDALIPTAGGAVVIWVLVFGPYLTEAGRPLDERIINSGYFCLTLALLAATLRLIVAPGVRVPSYRMLAAAVMAFFAADLLGTAGLTYGWDTRLLLSLTAFSGAVFAAAILHPSARHLLDTPADVEARLGAARLVMFGLALLIPPAVTLVEISVAVEVRTIDVVVIAVSSLVMIGLVLARMSRLVRARERIAFRERALRKAGERLVAAGTIQSVDGLAADAVVQVVDSALVVTAGIARHKGSGQFEVTEAVGERELVEVGSTMRFDTSDVIEMGELFRNSVPGRPRMLVYGARFEVPDEEDRVLFAFTDGAIDRHDRRAFESLGREVGLAYRGLLAAQMIERSRTERRFESLVQHSSDIVIVTDEELLATYASPAIERQLGWSVGDLLGRPITDLVPEAERDAILTTLRKLLESNPSAARSELAVYDAQGRRRLIDLTVTDLTSHPEVGGYVLNGRDVTEATQLRADLMHAAYHDALTGLPNRTQFTADIAARLQADGETPAAVMFIDLDDFKTINDGLGHAAGDNVLRAVARRLTEVTDPDHVAARLGGDEFALLVPDGSDVDAIDELARTVLDTIREPVDVDGRQITTSASMGVVVVDGTVSAEAVQRNADVAMYQAKAAGKGRFERFEHHMQTHALDRLELKADLRRALDQEQFELDYQPIVELQAMRTIGVEALVRWRHPERGRVRPDEFIPLAEETGLIHDLGMWVLEEACRQLADWRRDPATEHLRVAVNLSAKQLPEARLPEQIAQTIARHELPPEHITVEITENVLMDESDFTSRRLREIRDIGVSLAIDDFGTGYSSLGYLQRYPFDVLKIDRTFVSGLDQPGPNAEVAAAIIDLANRLEVRTVAEGIETDAELVELRSLGCACGQGYYLSRPTTPADIEARVRAERHVLGGEEPSTNGFDAPIPAGEV